MLYIFFILISSFIFSPFPLQFSFLPNINSSPILYLVSSNSKENPSVTLFFSLFFAALLFLFFFFWFGLIGSVMSKNILVTGGAGYIGSHTVLQLLLGGYRAVVVDNLDNSSDVAINRVKELAGEFGKNLSFHKVRWTVELTDFQNKKFVFLMKNY